MSEKSRVEKKSLVKKSIGQQFVKRKIIENTQIFTTTKPNIASVCVCVEGGGSEKGTHVGIEYLIFGI